MRPPGRTPASPACCTSGFGMSILFGTRAGAHTRPTLQHVGRFTNRQYEPYDVGGQRGSSDEGVFPNHMAPGEGRGLRSPHRVQRGLR